LSFLIKASKISKNGNSPEFIKQRELYKRLHTIEGIKEKEVLFPVEVVKEIRQSKYIFQTVRKGLTQDTFRMERLASLRELEFIYGHNFAFETGHGKIETVRNYSNRVNENDKIEFMKKILRFIPGGI
jgi:hypothetical protein